MTKFQKEKITKEYKLLNQRYDKLKDKLDKAEKEGNTENAKWYEERMESLLAQMEGILFVLKALEYYVEWDMKENSYHIKKM